jgi:hypothetical protein
MFPLLLGINGLLLLKNLICFILFCITFLRTLVVSHINNGTIYFLEFYLSKKKTIFNCECNSKCRTNRNPNTTGIFYDNNMRSHKKWRSLHKYLIPHITFSLVIEFMGPTRDLLVICMSFN